MTLHEAFIQEVVENLDDDTPRLIYADWLADNGFPDRAEFIRRHCQDQELDALRARYKGNWVEQCGLVMGWNEAIILFERRLREVMTWCQHNRDRLRTPELRPPSLCWESLATPRTQKERQGIVDRLTAARGRFVREIGKAPHVPGGRLLLFYPDDTLYDGAAEIESDGFFDVENVPAWDTWAFYADDDQREYGWCLVSWVPPWRVEAVNRGILVNPEQCVKWAADVQNRFTGHLAAAGLLE